MKQKGRMFLFLGIIFPVWTGTLEALEDYLAEAGQSAPFVELVEPLVETLQEFPYVLLGESTHGTAEFYRSRAKISRALLEAGTHRRIVVEGDWSAMARANAYVLHETGDDRTIRGILAGHDRWPHWMWGNEEFAELLAWMREANRELPVEERFRVYGMDIYAWPEDWDAVADWLTKTRSEEEVAAINEAMAPLLRHRDNWGRYGEEAWVYRTRGPQTIPPALAQIRGWIDASGLPSRAQAYLRVKVNAVAAAELHLRTSRLSQAESWNARARHMKEAVVMLGSPEEWGGVIVWAHNTHIGDARATPMREHGMVNIGRLLREYAGEENVYLLGQTTGTGSFWAGRQWGGTPEVMHHPQPTSGSLEDLLLKIFPDQPGWVSMAKAREAGREFPVIGHRAIGVLYQGGRPGGNDVPTLLPLRYDGLLFFPVTEALTPLAGN